MRRLSIPAGHMMAPKKRDIAALPGVLLRTHDSITWSTETFAQNQNANAIRWGTLYNFRFDADQPPQQTNATVGYFKTGSPMTGCDPGTFRERWLTNSNTNCHCNGDGDSNTDCDRYGHSNRNG